MNELILRLECNNPENVKKSLEPDIDNSNALDINIETNEEFLEIRIKGEKLGHIKAAMNSYLSLVRTLNELDDINKK